MTRWSLAGLLVLGTALPASAETDAAAALEPQQLEPYQIVRSLELVQDRLAGGDHASQPMQRKLLEMIDARFATRESARFENELNRRALLIYAMSGGNPATLEAGLAHLGKDDPNRLLGEKILLYVNGKPNEALEAFASVDPMTYSPDVGMYVALVKGSMMAEAEPGKALPMLDRARLLGPGTLVEEAALRRSISVAVTLGDTKRFLRYAEQYVRSYLHSPYASQFADTFVAGVVALQDKVDRRAVVDLAAMMEPEQEKVIYLRIARRAAIDGLIDLAAFAATQAEEMADDPRAELYASLSLVTSGEIDNVLERLSRIDRERLSENDRRLLDAASAIAAELTAGTKPAGAQSQARPIRSVGPEPVITAAGDETAKTTPVPSRSRSPGPGRGVDASVEKAEAMVAATRAKLADIDKLIGDMPE
ncbi:chemotaxis protein MotC [Mesorhizobium sp. ZMM04-5]|uniref:Chemotaxis protein MotC n=1 Tax=Mesorhizobium marinum TaxID=3228790 RepID=A0ABV3QTS0_9HYPH